MNAVTLVGVIDDDPHLTHTSAGAAATVFVLTSVSAYRDGEGVLREGEKTTVRVVCHRELAENVAACLPRGTRVVVVGALKVRSYEGRPGPIAEIEAVEVAASVRFSPLVVAERADVTPHTFEKETL